MNPFNRINRKKRNGKITSHVIQTGSLLILFGICGSILTACGPADQAPELPTVTPTALPTPTPLPPQPETALVNALQRFESAESYTIHTSLVYDSGTYATTYTTDSVNYIILSNDMSFLDSTSTFIVDPSLEKYCVQDTCYKKDATGLFKPSTGEFMNVVPSLNFLGMDYTDMIGASYTYLGEEILREVNAFKYEYIASDEQMSNPDLSLAEPRPKVNLYVDVQTGDLIQIDYTFLKMNNQVVDNYEVIKEYYDWNNTTFSIPEFVDAQNTEWQTYNGAYASAVTFDFPKTYFLNEDYGYPSLKTPSGSELDFTIYATIALLSNEQFSDLCPSIFNEFILAYDTTSPTLERAEWINGDAFNFCKGIINTTSGQRVEYLFNEPLDVAGRSGRLLPETFRIIIFPGEGEDLDTIFWDVIQTIRIGGSE